MRISDWSSDVCSSDLHGIKGPLAQTLRRVAETGEQGLDRIACGRLRATRRSFEPAPPHGPFRTLRPQPVRDGRDQCRDAEPFVETIPLVQSAQTRKSVV